MIVLLFSLIIIFCILSYVSSSYNDNIIGISGVFHTFTTSSICDLEFDSGFDSFSTIFYLILVLVLILSQLFFYLILVLCIECEKIYSIHHL